MADFTLEDEVYLTDLCRPGEPYWCRQCTGCDHGCHGMPIEAARDLRRRQGITDDLPYCAYCGMPIKQTATGWAHRGQPCGQQAMPTPLAEEDQDDE
jgi:hypothetical protein